MAKKKSKRRRRRSPAKRTTRRRKGKYKWSKINVAQSGQVAAALVLTEVIRERIDIMWLSEAALSFLFMAWLSKSETDKRVFVSVAVGSQIKEIADMAGWTNQIKQLIPGDQAAIPA